MNHDDGNQTENILESDIILIGVRTSKTPTSILANKGQNSQHTVGEWGKHSKDLMNQKKYV